jgi:tellurite resistance protein TehA-like permease
MRLTRLAKLIRAVFTILIGCIIIIPILFIIVQILMFISYIEKILFNSEKSIKLANQISELSTELLKTISGNK